MTTKPVDIPRLSVCPALRGLALSQHALSNASNTPSRCEDDPSLEGLPAFQQALAGTAGQSPPGLPGGPSGQARIHLIIGPVGAGKSTYALRLAREVEAVRLNLDEWMAVLFRPDRPSEGVMEWYAARTRRCIDQMWALTRQLIELGIDVILEIGLLSRQEREEFYERVDMVGFKLTVYVLDAARDVRRKRVEERNRMQGPTFSMVVPPPIFELASDLWQEPDALECDARDVRFSHTDFPHSGVSGSDRCDSPR